MSGRDKRLREIDDITTKYQSIIDTKLSQKAAFDSRFKERVGELLEFLEEDPNIRHLGLGQMIRGFSDNVVQMLLNNNGIIVDYGRFAEELIEAVDIEDEESEDNEKRLKEMEEQLEAIREQRDHYKQKYESFNSQSEIKEETQTKIEEVQNETLKSHNQKTGKTSQRESVGSLEESEKLENDISVEPEKIIDKDKVKTQSYCQTCELIKPIHLFPISKTGTVYRNCKDCYRKQFLSYKKNAHDRTDDAPKTA